MALRRITVVAQALKNGHIQRTCTPKCTQQLPGVSRANVSPLLHRCLSTNDFSEEDLARDAARRSSRDKPNIFQKILDGEIKADIIYEDDKCISFRDVNPVAPTHIIVIPRKPIPCLSEAADEDTPLLGHLLTVARKIAATEELKEGFRIVMNDGRHGAQSIYHLHVHIIGGRQMRWPPG
ncbi:uncharacterized HIT-like protein Synpcc7942_1390 [Asterias amurensis]|uniref:uncharacterized HIT-like protein Synpcc7942_1390 n=1 Tax=Asterias amurensis TaxID=7602 RepID=UPI003AB54FD9